MARYFVHLPTDGSPGIFWRGLAGSPGGDIHINLNLLAHAVGDDPATLLPADGTLTLAQHYVHFDPTVVPREVVPNVQPFTFTLPGGDVNRPQALPLGPNLRRFLDDPLGGERMDLSLPFYDEEIKLGPNGGGWFRNNNNNEADFHGGTDFVTSPTALFDVCAAADGRVLASDGSYASNLFRCYPEAMRIPVIIRHNELGLTIVAIGDL